MTPAERAVKQLQAEAAAKYHRPVADPNGSDNCGVCGRALLPDKDLGVRRHA